MDIVAAHWGTAVFDDALECIPVTCAAAPSAIQQAI